MVSAVTFTDSDCSSSTLPVRLATLLLMLYIPCAGVVSQAKKQEEKVSEGAVGVEEKSDVRMARVSKVLGRTGSRGGVTQVSSSEQQRALANERTQQRTTPR